MMTDPEPPQVPQDDDASPWWREHLGLLLGVVPLGLALLRVAGAARFDPVMAGAIVGRSNTLAILGSVFFVVAPLALIISAAPAWRVLRAEGAPPWMAGIYATAVPFVVILLAPVAHTIAALLLVVVWFALSVLGRAVPTMRLPKPAHGPLRMVVVISTVVCLLVLSSGVWVPPEMVTHERGRTFGYVLGEQGGWLTVLRERDRTLIMLKTDEVTDRVICRNANIQLASIRPLFERSPADFLGQRPGRSLPACPNRRGSDETPSAASSSDQSPSPSTRTSPAPASSAGPT